MTSIKKDLVSGVFYIAVAKYSGIVVQILITSILARLLLPSEFGVIAIATVIINFIRVIADLGMGPAIIQNKELDVNDCRSLFSLSLFLGLFLSCVFFFLSAPIANYYNNDNLLSVCKWMSIIVFFNTIGTLFDSLLMREKRFKFVAFRTLITQLLTGLVAIIAAYKGMGVFALVLQGLLSSIIIFLANYSQNRLTPKVNSIRESFNKIKRFSIYQFLFNIINYFSRNLDKLMVGKFLGTSMLGYYEKSYRLMMLPLQNLTDVVSPVMLPIFSQRGMSHNAIMSGYIKVLEILAFLSFPISAFLVFNARELILIFFGNNWEMSIAPFKILALSVSIQVLNSTTGSIFQSTGNTKGLMCCGLFSALFIIGSFFITIFNWGTISAVAVGFDIALFLAAAFSFSLLFKSMETSIVAFFKVLVKPFILFIIITIAMLLTNGFMGNVNFIASFFIKSIIIGIISIIYIQLFSGYNLKDLFMTLLMKKH